MLTGGYCSPKSYNKIKRWLEGVIRSLKNLREGETQRRNERGEM